MSPSPDTPKESSEEVDLKTDSIEAHLETFRLITNTQLPLEEVDAKIDASSRYEELIDRLKAEKH